MLDKEGLYKRQYLESCIEWIILNHIRIPSRYLALRTLNLILHIISYATNLKYVFKFKFCRFFQWHSLSSPIMYVTFNDLLQNIFLELYGRSRNGKMMYCYQMHRRNLLPVPSILESLVEYWRRRTRKKIPWHTYTDLLCLLLLCLLSLTLSYSKKVLDKIPIIKALYCNRSR
jgi:hypothetical protein